MFSSSITYLALFTALFFLPGFFLTVILGIKKFRFLLSFALSYSLLLLTLLPFEYYAQPIARWSAWVRWEWICLAVLAVARTFMYWNFNLRYKHDVFVGAEPRSAMCDPRQESSHRDATPTRQNPGKKCRGLGLIGGLLNPRLIVPLVLAGVICGYLAYAGVYLEIPADAWEHVRRFQWHKLSFIDQGYFPAGLALTNLLWHQEFLYCNFMQWYFIHAWLCNVSGLAIMDSLHVLTFVNVLVFLLAIYYFGLFLFAGLRISPFRKMTMAALAALFAAATIGNIVFAYVRYYAFAHAILNYVLFLAAMAVIIAWLRAKRWFGHALWMAPVLLIAANMIHTQEALFIFFMTLALSLAESGRLLWRKFRYRNFKVVGAPLVGDRSEDLPASQREALQASGHAQARPLHLFSTSGRSVYGNHWPVSEWKTVILAAVLLFLFFAGFSAIRYFKPGSWISPHMIMPHTAIPPEPVNFIFQKLMISPPQNFYLRLAVYQLFIFYQVVGCWGLFVYLLFLLMYRRFIKLPYLAAGLIIVPLLTAFNPLLIDMMARLGQDMTLYRFHYLVPLPFVGGYLFVHFAGKAREWLRETRLGPTKSEKTATTKRGPPIYAKNNLFRQWRDALCRVHRTFIVSSWLNFAGSILVLAGLIGLVFPINAAGIYAPYSKIYTLRKIPAGNNYQLWDDLGKFIAKFENKVVLTGDGQTGRIMMCYAPKNQYVHSKWMSSTSPGKGPPETYTWESLRDRGLIVINRRDGAPGITGKIARHWPEDVLNISGHYSPETQNYLESHPEKFRKIWSRNQIAVYAVR